MLEKVSLTDMEGKDQDLATTVLTCEGDLKDPAFPYRLQSLVHKLQRLISNGKRAFWLKKVEPWNSVRVTFSIPREAAQRLRQLAEQGDHVLRDLGILSVQIEGDQVITLTLAGRYSDHQELVLRKSPETTQAVDSQGTTSNSSFDLPGSENLPGPSNVEATRKNIAQYLSQQGTAVVAGTSSETSDSIPRRQASASAGSAVGFRSPNVVAPASTDLPFLTTSIAGTGRLTPGSVRPQANYRPFPFASMTHAMNTKHASTPHHQSGVTGRFTFPHQYSASATTSQSSTFTSAYVPQRKVVPSSHATPPPNVVLSSLASRIPGTAPISSASSAASRANIALSSPLLVNLLQSDAQLHSNKMLPPPAPDLSQAQKRKRKPRKPKEKSPEDSLSSVVGLSPSSFVVPSISPSAMGTRTLPGYDASILVGHSSSSVTLPVASHIPQVPNIHPQAQGQPKVDTGALHAHYAVGSPPVARVAHMPLHSLPYASCGIPTVSVQDTRITTSSLLKEPEKPVRTSLESNPFPSPPPSTDGKTKHLINPFTGHLEPMPSDEEEEEESLDSLPLFPDFELEASENGQSERSLSDGGKDNNHSSDTDSGICKSITDLSQSSADLTPSDTRKESPPSAVEDTCQRNEEPIQSTIIQRELKLRLKLDHRSVKELESKRAKMDSVIPNPGGKVDVSFVNIPGMRKLNSVPSEPKVPPLHISLRGPNAAVVVSPRKDDKPRSSMKDIADHANNIIEPKKPRSPRNSRLSVDCTPKSGESTSRKIVCREFKRSRSMDKSREQKLLTGGGIVQNVETAASVLVREVVPTSGPVEVHQRKAIDYSSTIPALIVPNVESTTCKSNPGPVEVGRIPLVVEDRSEPSPATDPKNAKASDGSGTVALPTSLEQIPSSCQAASSTHKVESIRTVVPKTDRTIMPSERLSRVTTEPDIQDCAVSEGVLSAKENDEAPKSLPAAVVSSLPVNKNETLEITVPPPDPDQLQLPTIVEQDPNATVSDEKPPEKEADEEVSEERKSPPAVPQLQEPIAADVVPASPEVEAITAGIAEENAEITLPEVKLPASPIASEENVSKKNEETSTSDVPPCVPIVTPQVSPEETAVSESINHVGTSYMPSQTTKVWPRERVPPETASPDRSDAITTNHNPGLKPGHRVCATMQSRNNHSDSLPFENASSDHSRDASENVCLLNFRRNSASSPIAKIISVDSLPLKQVPRVIEVPSVCVSNSVPIAAIKAGTSIDSISIPSLIPSDSEVYCQSVAIGGEESYVSAAPIIHTKLVTVGRTMQSLAMTGEPRHVNHVHTFKRVNCEDSTKKGLENGTAMTSEESSLDSMDDRSQSPSPTAYRGGPRRIVGKVMPRESSLADHKADLVSAEDVQHENQNQGGKEDAVPPMEKAAEELMEEKSEKPVAVSPGTSVSEVSNISSMSEPSLLDKDTKEDVPSTSDCYANSSAAQFQSSSPVQQVENPLAPCEPKEDPLLKAPLEVAPTLQEKVEPIAPSVAVADSTTVSTSVGTALLSCNRGVFTTSGETGKVTLIFKSGASGTHSHSLLSTGTTSGSVVVPFNPSTKTVPIKLVALPSGASSLTGRSGNSTLFEIIGQSSSSSHSFSSSLPGSASPVRLVVSKMAPVKSSATTTTTTVVVKSVVVTGTSSSIKLVPAKSSILSSEDPVGNPTPPGNPTPDASEETPGGKEEDAPSKTAEENNAEQIRTSDEATEKEVTPLLTASQSSQPELACEYQQNMQETVQQPSGGEERPNSPPIVNQSMQIAKEAAELSKVCVSVAKTETSNEVDSAISSPTAATGTDVVVCAAEAETREAEEVVVVTTKEEPVEECVVSEIGVEAVRPSLSAEPTDDPDKRDLVFSKPLKRKCSENAAELIKACMGVEDNPKRSSRLREDSNKEEEEQERPRRGKTEELPRKTGSEAATESECSSEDELSLSELASKSRARGVSTRSSQRNNCRGDEEGRRRSGSGDSRKEEPKTTRPVFRDGKKEASKFHPGEKVKKMPAVGREARSGGVLRRTKDLDSRILNSSVKEETNEPQLAKRKTRSGGSTEQLDCVVATPATKRRRVSKDSHR